MSFVNVLEELGKGIGLTLTSIPTTILFTPNVNAIDGKGVMLAAVSGEAGTLCTASSFVSGCIMWSSVSETSVNSGTLGSPAWSVIS